MDAAQNHRGENAVGETRAPEIYYWHEGIAKRIQLPDSEPQEQDMLEVIKRQ